MQVVTFCISISSSFLGQIDLTKTTENTRELNKMLFTGHTTTELADILENLNEQSLQSISAVEVIKGTHETVCD